MITGNSNSKTHQIDPKFVDSILNSQYTPEDKVMEDCFVARIGCLNDFAKVGLDKLDNPGYWSQQIAQHPSNPKRQQSMK